MTDFHILDGHKPVKVAGLLDWARQIEWRDRDVADDHLGAEGPVRFATVFFDIDTGSACDGRHPLLFETRVLGGAFDGMCERHAAWDQAAAGHQRVLALAQGECE
jgi:hypothetical protein